MLVPFLQKYSDPRSRKPSVSTCATVYRDKDTKQHFELHLKHSIQLFFPLICQVLKLELKEIREQQDLLFRFMNFLKQEGAVHVLQFCLAVGECVPPLLNFCFCQHTWTSSVAVSTLNVSEEFNDRILCPELPDSEKIMLYEEVKKIYETYCLDESVDKIRFDPFIVEEIRNSM